MGLLASLKKALSPKPKLTAEQMLMKALSAPPSGPSVTYPGGYPGGYRGRYGGWNGEKFRGGIWDNPAPTIWDWADYETLRHRSEEIFQRNIYAKGLLRRLVTNIVHTGLQLEATPVESVIGVPEDSMLAWAEDVEQRFNLWADTPVACHHQGALTWGQIQEQVLLEALAGGDCLMVLRQDRETKLPTVEVFQASAVCGFATNETPEGNRVDYGVERDVEGRQVAYYIGDYSTGQFRQQRIPAFDSQGRRQAWLVYGSERRVRTVRGEPLLATVIQSLKEIDQYRDSAQRKAVVNSILALFIRKDRPVVGTNPLSNAATAFGEDEVTGSTSGEAEAERFSFMGQVPGLVIEELAEGEVPVGFDNRGVDTSFGDFERAVMFAVAWGMEIPPEIAFLSFNANYSASQAALNEFRIFLSKYRTKFGANVCQPVYADWLLSAALLNIVDAPGYVRVAGNRAEFMTAAAWVKAEWAGAVKPTTDIKKTTEAYMLQVEAGFTTRELATKELNGRKFSNNVRKLKTENEMLKEANASLAPVSGEIQVPPSNDGAQPDDEDDASGDESEEGNEE